MPVKNHKKINIGGCYQKAKECKDHKNLKEKNQFSKWEQAVPKMLQFIF